MKTLQQVQSLIPVDTLAGDATATHIINLPGSYYFTGNDPEILLLCAFRLHGRNLNGEPTRGLVNEGAFSAGASEFWMVTGRSLNSRKGSPRHCG